ncbi:AtpZ/AtpI family protein [Dermatobacter hominis]|uniref:AtpZ/AtpI family protein n=1 Tax=Dermatobacter hominis TaxID=2884263 RepID=UPI001D112CD3|nr:AtpZ/AtpI family protein [Dermatobacter hominis]UDY37209.1 AtpZ/AtpI family protein [Dermatobacter hominis]
MAEDRTDTEPSEGSQTELTRSLNRSAGSFELVFAPVIMALIGLWLDRTFDTVPLFTVGLAIFGALGAGASMYFSYHRQLEQLAAQGRIPVERPARQYHFRNRSDARPAAVDADELPGEQS